MYTYSSVCVCSCNYSHGLLAEKHRKKTHSLLEKSLKECPVFTLFPFYAKVPKETKGSDKGNLCVYVHACSEGVWVPGK